jgi:ATP-binding protein involved in chromosome partitioning
VDVRKELNFCKKTGLEIIGVVENMSGFVCPNCKCESVLFKKSSGGAEKMCLEFGCSVVARIPFEPKIQEMID